jgi:hypothetical protein
MKGGLLGGCSDLGVRCLELSDQTLFILNRFRIITNYYGITVGGNAKDRQVGKVLPRSPRRMMMAVKLNWISSLWDTHSSATVFRPMFRPTNQQPVCLAKPTSSYSPGLTNQMGENEADSSDFTTLGFIGLGAMGKPMVEQLANKLPQESHIWVYDVVEDVVDEICAAFPGRISKAASAKNVAEQTVCI